MFDRRYKKVESHAGRIEDAPPYLGHQPYSKKCCNYVCLIAEMLWFLLSRFENRNVIVIPNLPQWPEAVSSIRKLKGFYIWRSSRDILGRGGVGANQQSLNLYFYIKSN